jgi:Uri superfamily endonuclease
MNQQEVSVTKGVYVLTIDLKRQKQIKIGSLGQITFESGTYVYVGSAQNGLENRIKRHLSKNKKTFWHIDYFLKSGDSVISKVLIKVSPKSMECEIARSIAKDEKGIPHFGSSDCKCESHFFKVKDVQNLLSHLKSDFDMVEI